MYNSVNLADMRQKLITETLALGGTFYKTRYIDKFDYRGSYFLGEYILASSSSL